MFSKPLLLLTDPAHFEVSYRINPWMQPYAWAEDPAGHLAAAQRSFQGLAKALTAAGARLEIMPGVASLPDMVFPANAAVVLDRRALVARFRHPERKGEEQHFQEQFRVLIGRGFLEEVAQFPATCLQEGAGDCIWDSTRGRFWAGYGQRSTRQAADEVAAFFGREVTALELVSPRFYHLDVCFCPLRGGEILHYPPAFSAASLAAIRDVVAAEDDPGDGRGRRALQRQRSQYRRPASDGERLAPPRGTAGGARLPRERGRSPAVHHVRRRRLLHDLTSRLPQHRSRRVAARRGIVADHHRGENAKRSKMIMTADTMLRDPPPPMRDSYHALEREYGARNYKPFDVVLTRGLGVWLWDVDGRRYLDCLSAYSAVNQGHSHPRILAALAEQASRLAITSRAFMNDQLPLFYKELCAVTHSHKVLPMNSRAEAVETAVKVARKWGYEVKGVPKDRAEVIVCANNFHGRTLTISSALAPTLRRATASARSRRVSALCHLPIPPRSKRRSPPIRSPSWSSPSRARRG